MSSLARWLTPTRTAQLETLGRADASWQRSRHGLGGNQGDADEDDQEDEADEDDHDG